VNTYDPADSIVYRHMNRRTDPYTVPVTNTCTPRRLPAGYVNSSPRTRLASHPARPA
jgi:hypothetical protein